VLGVIHAHAFNAPISWPSQQLVADLLGIQRETVNRACAWLRRHGFLDWHQERSPGRPWRHNVYRLLCTWVRPYRKTLLKRLQQLRKASSLATAAFSVRTHSERTPKSSPNRHDRAAERAWEARAGP
jgi:DNA-binding IclR family transcriptional regulator